MKIKESKHGFISGRMYDGETVIKDAMLHMHPQRADRVKPTVTERIGFSVKKGVFRMVVDYTKKGQQRRRRMTFDSDSIEVLRAALAAWDEEEAKRTPSI